jgi:hypothetical protein
MPNSDQSETRRRLRRAAVEAAEWGIRVQNTLMGISWPRDPWRYFGPGGVDEAERLCLTAGRDFLRFVRPRRGLKPTGWASGAVRRPEKGLLTQDIYFDSPRPSGRPPNDRVALRVFRPRRPVANNAVVMFHHGLYQDHPPLWAWFLGDLIDRLPVALMAAPYHGPRVPDGEYPGEGCANANPWHFFEAARQWCWDAAAAQAGLSLHLKLEPRACIGFSMGAALSLLLAAAGRCSLPLVSIAAPNRYAHGIVHSRTNRGLRQAMQRVGIDARRLERMTEKTYLERHVGRLKDHRLLYIDGVWDAIDPAPSLGRLKQALQPMSSLHLEAGHGTLFFYRKRINQAIEEFLQQQGVLPGT